MSLLRKINRSQLYGAVQVGNPPFPKGKGDCPITPLCVTDTLCAQLAFLV